MGNLYCTLCSKIHDLDLAPDTGVCSLCGGSLIEKEEERYSNSFQEAVVDAVNDGMVRAFAGRGKAKRGDN